MIDNARPAPRQRVAVLAAVVALHAGLMGLFVLQRSAAIGPPIKPSLITVVAIAAERPAAARPPPQRMPAKLAETFEPVVEFAIPTDTPSDAPAGPTGACSIPAGVLAALLADAAAVDAIRHAPPEARSIAQAIVIWNNGWSPYTANPGSPLSAPRATIERSLAAAPDGCLDEPVTGPRLIPIADGTGTGTIFLVFGSGNWTWRALLLPAALPAAPVTPLTPAAPIRGASGATG